MDFSIWDMANTHGNNDELSERDHVIQFFHHIGNAFRPTYELIAWLATEPFRMEDSESAIPLFRHRDIDYQIHPSYPSLPAREMSDEIEPYHNQLRIMRVPTEGSVLVIPFGRFCVNKLYTDPDDPSKVARRSKWTGYSVFLDIYLNIWLVFNPASLKNRHHGWFPARCHLFNTENSSTGAPFDFDDTVDTVPFLSARITLNGNFARKNLTLENFSRGINDTKQSEKEVELQVVGEERACEVVCRSHPFARDVPLLQDQATDPTLGFSRPSGLPMGDWGELNWEKIRTRMRPDLQRAAGQDEGYWTSTSGQDKKPYNLCFR